MRFNLHPPVLTNTILIYVIEALIVVGACEQIYVTISKYALVPCSWRENLTLGVYFDPLIHLHLCKVLFRVGSLPFLLLFKLSWQGHLYIITVSIEHVTCLS